VPAAVIDVALAVGTGQRTVQGANGRGAWKGVVDAATKGVSEAREVMAHGQTATELERSTGAHRQMNTGIRWLDTYTNFVFRTLGASDRVFKSYAYRRAMEEMAALEAVKRGESPIEVLANPPEWMIAEAIAAAEFATFNNPNMAAKTLKQAQAYLRRQDGKGKIAGRLGAFGIDILVPFANTPANLLMRMIDYSLIGGIVRPGLAVHQAIVDKAMTKESQRAFSMGIGRGLIGSSLMYFGWQLAAAGLMSGGSGDEEPADRAVRDAAGRLPGAILVGKVWRQVNAFAPGGNLLTVGASLHRQSTKNLAEEAKRLDKQAAVIARVAMEQPMLRGMADLVDSLKNPASRGESWMTSTVGSFVPTLLADIAGAFDPYRRDARPEGVREALWNGVQARLPGLRNVLPARRDVFGRDMPQEWTALWDPTIASAARELDEPVLRELIMLDVGVGFPQRSAGESREEYRERAKAVGKAIERNLGATIRSGAYQRASRDQRIEILEATISATRNAMRRR
jgi:hypothetical protein